MKEKRCEAHVQLHISVAVDNITNVRVWIVNAQTGEEKELSEGMHYTLGFAQRRTERCQVCERSYPASDIVRRGSEQLCIPCDMDRYPIQPEDIPF
jgi:hypothetical protein